MQVLLTCILSPLSPLSATVIHLSALPDIARGSATAMARVLAMLIFIGPCVKVGDTRSTAKSTNQKGMPVATTIRQLSTLFNG